MNTSNEAHPLGAKVVPVGPPGLSHDELAIRLGEDVWNDSARYVHAWRSWLQWDGARWQRDEKLRHLTECRQFLQDVAAQVDREAREKAKKHPDNAGSIIKQSKVKTEWLRSAATVAAVEGMARSNAELAATVDQFDANLDVIGTPGGTVDLRTGKLRPAMRADFITRLVAVAPSAATPSRWLQFLDEAMDGDRKMIRFLQRLCGYALTGHTIEHKLPFLFGPGGNGKSVFANTLHGLLGDYAARAPADAFLQSRGERHPTDIAGLAGARLVVASELPAGRSWNESVIKDLTGGDVIKARFMRQDFFEFKPQFALLIVGNHMPSIGSVDEAMRRRIVLIPFTHEVPAHKRDPDLENKLRAEWPGILQWAIEGAVVWYREGLPVPDKVASASGEYLDAEDELGQFMDECLTFVRGGGAGDLSSVIYAEYAKWGEPRGGRAMSQRAFSQAMRERGVSVTKERDGRHCAGWWIKENA